jgi:SAM-dependent methyltransferase
VSRSLPFDRIADTYDQTRGGEDRGRRFARELEGELDRSAPVLEVGIGTGVVALGLRESGYSVVGLDLSLPMLAAARSRVGGRVAAGDARRLPLRSGSFEQAYSVWVLHVVGDVAGVLGEVGRILRPGGRYLVVPAMGDRPGDPIGSVLWDMQRALDREGNRNDQEDRLVRLAPAAGLRVVDSRTWAPFDYEESPADAIRKIETESYSVLWHRTEDELAKAVRPAIAALRALPDPERRIKRTSTDRLVILEKPGGA